MREDGYVSAHRGQKKASTSGVRWIYRDSHLMGMLGTELKS